MTTLLYDLLWPYHLLKNLNIPKPFYTKICVAIMVILFAHKIDFQMNKNCVLFLFSVTRPDMSPPSVMIVSVSRYQYCHQTRLKTNKIIRKLLDLSLTKKLFLRRPQLFHQSQKISSQAACSIFAQAVDAQFVLTLFLVLILYMFYEKRQKF